jgi:hypothetical protein
MSNVRHAAVGMITMLLHATAWIIGASILLALPALGTHHYGTLYRTTEVRQSAARHTFLAQADTDSIDCAREQGTEPCDAIPAAAPVDFPSESSGAEMAPRVSLTRFLMRLKLGASRSGDPAPIL